MVFENEQRLLECVLQEYLSFFTSNFTFNLISLLAILEWTFFNVNSNPIFSPIESQNIFCILQKEGQQKKGQINDHKTFIFLGELYL